MRDLCAGSSITVRPLVAVFSLVLMVLVLIDGFESILQPRRVTRKYRIARLYYAGMWAIWRGIARLTRTPRRRAAFLSAFGPLSILGIFVTWIVALVFAFGLLNWSLGNPIATAAGLHPTGIGTYLYLSGTTFFTLGYGDVTPTGRLGRALAVGESGLGFGFLSYLPALFQAYSRREVIISLLDARAGSPPSGAQLLLRSARAGSPPAVLDAFLAEWERWAAELLESQLSFPVLGYYRSQHDNQSWLAALATALDACAILLTQVRGINTYQAQVTFAIARHAAVDLALILRAPVSTAPPPHSEDRLTAEQLWVMRAALAAAGVQLHDADKSEKALRDMRATYEPFLRALASRLLLTVPPILTDDGSPDNWQRSAWMRPSPGIGALPVVSADVSHFE
jgi:hypothetical protein